MGENSSVFGEFLKTKDADKSFLKFSLSFHIVFLAVKVNRRFAVLDELPFLKPALKKSRRSRVFVVLLPVVRIFLTQYKAYYVVFVHPVVFVLFSFRNYVIGRSGHFRHVRYTVPVVQDPFKG